MKITQPRHVITKEEFDKLSDDLQNDFYFSTSGDYQHSANRCESCSHQLPHHYSGCKSNKAEEGGAA